MAKAIHNGVNIKENCVHYLKDVAENDMQKLSEIREKEQQEEEVHKQALAELTEQFITLSDNIKVIKCGK